ncbi:nuclear transport factor 2 family protein [Duganella sp. FT92W]|uniref:Nuclear transport factor 2 family protein n=1 Tax=Pseudoduganella rivuli TaxID=2666085 RepID=A0A7X2IN01_9BURK|nr:nuclear transport factor 2 family protein [Pseudoduganella rivuli]MRV72850.1 nuclear transport factor 2 family protein [Pseudoduganella rivuli]
MAEPQLQDAAAASLKQWHAMVARRELGALPALLAPGVVFRSPMAHTPYPGPQATSMILGTVIDVFEGFTYHRELASADGLSVVLEFSATVHGKELKGIDMIRFDEQGRIVEFEVMVRPLSGLQALGEEMGRRLGPVLAQMKGA